MKRDGREYYREVVKGKHSFLTIPALDSIGKALHFFTSRQNAHGGNANGMQQPDDWKYVAGVFGIDRERVVTVHQVHGDNIVTVDDRNFRSMGMVEADAMITNAPGIAIGVETADCLPVLLLDPAVPAVAAVHAGWRSTVKKIVGKTAQRMQQEFGSDPTRLLAAFGPAIGPECYEVDEPVMGRVREAFSFWKDVAVPRGNDKWGLDLVETNRLVLMEAGLREKNIHSLGMCTACRTDLFYSYRAEGRTGRMLSVIMIKQ